MLIAIRNVTALLRSNQGKFFHKEIKMYGIFGDIGKVFDSLKLNKLVMLLYNKGTDREKRRLTKELHLKQRVILIITLLKK